MKIDVHAHHIPARFHAGDGEFRITRAGSDAPVMTWRRGATGESISNFDVRLREMDLLGVDMHVLSVLPTLFVNHLDPAARLEACRQINDAFAVRWARILTGSLRSRTSPCRTPRRPRAS